MARRKVMLTISEETLRRARHLAVERGVSVSKFLSDRLETVVARDERYEEARRRWMTLMEKGVDLGLGPGSVTWSRDELHER